MHVRTKIPNFKKLMELHEQKIEITYDNGLNTGIVRRAEFDPDEKCHVIIVKHENSQGLGLRNLSTFKFFRSKPNEIQLSGFYYEKEVTDQPS